MFRRFPNETEVFAGGPVRGEGLEELVSDGIAAAGRPIGAGVWLHRLKTGKATITGEMPPAR